MCHNKLMSTMSSSYSSRFMSCSARTMSSVSDGSFSRCEEYRPFVPQTAKYHMTIKTLVKRRQLFQQEMIERWTITLKFRLLKIAFMIHPCCSLTVAISLILSKSILLSARCLYIATVCSRFSSKPVHHLISLALSTAWLVRRYICWDFMNKMQQ